MKISVPRRWHNAQSQAADPSSTLTTELQYEFSPAAYDRIARLSAPVEFLTLCPLCGCLSSPHILLCAQFSHVRATAATDSLERASFSSLLQRTRESSEANNQQRHFFSVTLKTPVPPVVVCTPWFSGTKPDPECSIVSMPLMMPLESEPTKVAVVLSVITPCAV